MMYASSPLSSSTGEFVVSATRCSRTRSSEARRFTSGLSGKTWKRSRPMIDRKSTRLNSSHGYISYAVFCLKKKKKQIHGNAYTDGHGDMRVMKPCDRV